MGIDDPRIFPDGAAHVQGAPLYALAQASLRAATAQDAAAIDADLDRALEALLGRAQGARLADVFAFAPSPAVYRHMWRALARLEAAGAPDRDAPLRLFAIPVIVVAGIVDDAVQSVTLPAVVDPEILAGLLREHRALGGHETISLSNVLAGTEAIDLARLPGVLAWQVAPAQARDIAPAPLVVAAGSESVHLRFLVGSVIAAPGADPLRDRKVGAWGIPFAQALGRELATPGTSVLALPRAPQPLVTAVREGRQAQREVGAQIFASNAIRKLRAATGEPTAVISVHRVGDAGEVRLSLSSPFDPRNAEGFRCSLDPLDRVDDVVQMLTTLLADCRVVNVRVMPGIHPDRDPATGLTLLFKADGPAPAAVH